MAAIFLVAIFFWRYFSFSLFGCGCSRYTSMQNFKLLNWKLINWRPFCFLAAILFLADILFFTFWLQAVKIYLQAKFRASGSKIGRVMLNFVFCSDPTPSEPVTNLRGDAAITWLIHCGVFKKCPKYVWPPPWTPQKVASKKVLTPPLNDDINKMQFYFTVI